MTLMIVNAWRLDWRPGSGPNDSYASEMYVCFKWLDIEWSLQPRINDFEFREH